jgi:Large ribosomal RNA subunit accumulation protein YceD
MKSASARTDLVFSHPLAIADLPPEGAAVTLVPDEAERAALARHVDALAVPRLVAELKATPDGKGGVAIEGDLAATVRQTCVVSLEPFDNTVNEHLDLRFLPEGTASAGAEEADERDVADIISGGVIDLGAIVAEFLALGVDPYPRRPGATFAAPQYEDGGSSSFAELAKLKAKSRQGD